MQKYSNMNTFLIILYHSAFESKAGSASKIWQLNLISILKILKWNQIMLSVCCWHQNKLPNCYLQIACHTRTFCPNFLSATELSSRSSPSDLCKTAAIEAFVLYICFVKHKYAPRLLSKIHWNNFQRPCFGSVAQRLLYVLREFRAFTLWIFFFVKSRVDADRFCWMYTTTLHYSLGWLGPGFLSDLGKFFSETLRFGCRWHPFRCTKLQNFLSRF